MEDWRPRSRGYDRAGASGGDTTDRGSPALLCDVGRCGTLSPMMVAARLLLAPRTTRVSAPRPLVLVLMLVASLGIGLRLAPLLVRGAVAQGFDSGVYYAASAALQAAHLPYRDLVFVHPPGVVFALAPITWLGDHVLGHIAAFELAGILSGILAGFTIFTIGLLANRWRGPVAGIVAAMF